jgi:hypothetical protein
MSRSRRPLVALAVVAGLAASSFTTFSEAASRGGATAAPLKQALANAPRALPEPRTPSAADRYAPANGCFALRSVASGKLVARTAAATAAAVAANGATGEPFRFQAMDLGKYLLVGAKSDFLATAADPLPTREAAAVARGFVAGTGDSLISPVREPVLEGLDTAATVVETATAPVEAQVRGDGLELAAAPSASAEWVLKQVGRAFVLQQAFSDGDESTPGPVDPPIAATVTAAADGTLSAAAGALTTAAAQFRLEPAKGCVVFPESQVGVTGPVVKGQTPYGLAQGYVDAHMHLMSQEFLGGRVMCGRTWHPYGIAAAMTDCPDHQTADGRGAVLEDFLAGATPGTGHDPVGWPTFADWPRHDSLTHVGSYYKWLERNWRAGQRLLTALLVENNVLCEIYPYKKNSCDEMESVRREALRVFELQRYVDAQAGGPGRGWFRVVTDPLQARRVINAGRLAVVLGIEVSRPLGCREILGNSTCTDEQVEQQMQAVHDLGVRQMEMTNKFDNAFTGVKGDGGAFGVLVNNANVKETGHYWKMATCDAATGKDQHDNQQYNLADESGGALGRDALFGAILATSGPSGAAPAYASGPHCNQIGLTAQGRRFLEEMIERGMVFDPDHMSVPARNQALELLKQKGYSGVISSHSWADNVIEEKVLALGGVVTPYAGGSSGFLGNWGRLRTKADPRFLYGIGWGSDINGFGSQGGPRNPAAGKGVSYPFTGFGGVKVDKLRAGQKAWDVNTEGVAQYGLYADWVRDVEVQAGPDAAAFRRDLANGIEAYLQMWERALGVPGDSCRRDVPDVTKADLKLVKKGMTPEQVVAVLGQPHVRKGKAFSYCGKGGAVTVRFSAAGRVA